MSNQVRTNYRGRLSELRDARPYDRELVQALCPHLTPDQLQDSLQVLVRGTAFIALPPVKVRGSFNELAYKPGDQMLGTPGEISVFTGLRTRSQVSSQPFDSSSESQFLPAATAYAEEHWGDELIADTWVNTLKVFVQDPLTLQPGSRWSLVTQATITVGLSRNWNDVMNDRSQPRVDAWDAAIVIASLDSTEGSEIEGGRGSFMYYSCARCGGGLGLVQCYGCGATYLDDMSRSGEPTPLPPKLVTLLRESGHNFAMEPELLY